MVEKQADTEDHPTVAVDQARFRYVYILPHKLVSFSRTK